MLEIGHLITDAFWGLGKIGFVFSVAQAKTLTKKVEKISKNAQKIAGGGKNYCAKFILHFAKIFCVQSEIYYIILIKKRNIAQSA